MPSGPIKTKDFTTQLYRDAGLGEGGVVGDIDGSSYRVHPPVTVTSRTLALGSDTQRSRLHAGGLFSHWIDKGARENVVDPVPEVAAPRRFLVVARFDPLLEGRFPQGPTDLRLLAGPEGQPNVMPSHDNDDEGVSDTPLWTLVANPGQPLSDILYDWVGNHMGPSLSIADGLGLPSNVPIGTIARWENATYTRARGGEQGAHWELDAPTKRLWSTNRGGGSQTDQYGQPLDGAHAEIMRVNLPVNAPAGVYTATANVSIGSADGSTRLQHTFEMVWPKGVRGTFHALNDWYETVTLTWSFYHPGGAGPVMVRGRVGAAFRYALLYNGACYMDVVYQGPQVETS